ncbi:prepilin-type N-terminal cleavage/methylation domain-containing protein [Desulfofundulus sp. TPOSR]|uniref:prepilin-type N-terminal cleavage/methylation domain-containing protein n=1 Tax=Desulfofundulus sp. TPOSR TaxID=2714340 RepID=UPI00140A6415|nr:prepilin-type N-terminal cleavage/methylation domain-containing protein [Desulfofundulus sp. TPOSR]NHM27798.1 prepilin-type N-terminal cleavage/methylation domain-containing protein [Desulfofundulus sp. TPOSR]
MRKKLRNNRGFTLVELLVVIAIIGILAAIIAPNAFKAIEKGKVAAAEADYKAIKAAALNAYTDTGLWAPSSDSAGEDPGLVNASEWENPPSNFGWNGPYLERWPSKNPWGGTYTYKNSATSGTQIPNNHTWGTGTNFRWLELDKVPGVGSSPKDAAAKLKSDLGADVVYVPSEGNTVYILISKDE